MRSFMNSQQVRTLHFDVTREFAEQLLRFLVGVPHVPVEERLLKTVMFTDIVGSTEQL